MIRSDEVTADWRQGASTALRLAVDRVGSQAAFARLIGLKQPSVWAWLRAGKVLPGDYVLKVEAATGVPKEQLRPDLYPPELGESDRTPDSLRSDNHRAAGAALDPLP